MSVPTPVGLTLLVVGNDPSLVDSAVEAGLDGQVEASVGVVPDVVAAADAVGADPPDCVVVQTGEIAEEAAAVVDRLAAIDADRPVVLVTDDEDGVSAGLEAGAADVILRDVANDRPELLAARIRRAVGTCSETGLPGSPGWYDALLEQSVDALTVLDVDGNITYQNPSVERLLGYEPEALVGTDSAEYIHPDDRVRVRATFERLIERGDRASDDLQFRFRHADGSWEWFESVATVRFDAGIRGFVVNSRLITERMEREREVERYETLLSVLPDTISITDLDGNILDIYGFHSWSGYEREELIGEHASVITPDRDFERAKEVVTALIRDDDREKAIYESAVETKAGETIPIENHMTTLPADDNGEIPGTMNVLRDISDRKEREQELEKAETVFSNVQDGVFLIEVTDDGRFELQRTNPAFTDAIGLGDVDVRGMTPYDLAGPDLGADIEARLQQCVEERAPIEYEDSFELGGDVRHHQNRIAPVIEDGAVVGLVGVSRDVTERRRRQQELRLKNRAIDEAPIGISLTDVGNDEPAISFVNEGFRTLTGYDKDDLGDGNWSQLFGRETDEEAIEDFEAAVERAEAVSSEILIYQQDGTPKWCQVSLSPILDQDGEVSHVAAFQQDITDLKEYETEIERRFDEFADVFAEDLREPLERAQDAVAVARENGDEEALESAAEWIGRADSLLADLAEVHSFSVPSRDHSESALLGADSPK